MSTVRIEHLVKTFEKGTVKAVNDVSFSVNSGELFGLIGPDGAGKTTIFRMLTTLLLPDSGRATVNDYDIVKDYRAIRACVGYMPGRFSLYHDLTVEENLTFFATVFNTTIKENYDLVKPIYEQIEPFKTRRAGKLSGGMKQKLALCCALIHRPVVLFLDEPTTGVDVVSRREFWDMLRALKQQGITILVSTPYMDEAKLCDRIGLIQDGTILSMDTPSRIMSAFPKRLFAARSASHHSLLQVLRADPLVETCYAFGEFVHVTLASGDNTDEHVRALKQKHASQELTMQEISPTIEDSFIRLMNEAAS